MAVDYLFVGIVLTFVMAMIFMLLALENREFPNSVIYHFFATILFVFEAQLILMAHTPSAGYTIPLHYIFYLFGIINFILFLAWGASSFAQIMHSRKYGEEED